MSSHKTIFSTLLLLFFMGCPIMAKASKPTQISIPIPGDNTLLILPVDERSFRLVMFPKNASPSLETEVIVSKTTGTFSSVSETDDYCELKLPEASLKVDKKQGTVTFYDAQGKLVLEELPEFRTIESADLRGEKTLRVQAGFSSPRDEYIFGTGQFQDGYMNIRDLPRRLTQVNTQIASPYIYSSKGYSLMWLNHGLTDYNPADAVLDFSEKIIMGEGEEVQATSTTGTVTEKRVPGEFHLNFKIDKEGEYVFLLDVGQSMAQKHYVEIDGKVIFDFSNIWLPPTTSFKYNLSPGNHTITVKGRAEDKPRLYYRPSQDATVWRSPVATQLDYVVSVGIADKCIASYRSMTGEVPLFPQWSLGYIHCRERYKSQKELLENAEEFRKRRIPIDIIVQDWQYWGDLGWNAMQFDSKSYPDPKKMVDDVHGLNMRLMLSVWSKIDPNSEVGKEFSKHNLYIPGTQWIDFFNPKAAELYWSNFNQRLVQSGIDSWWLDATEPENDDLTNRETYAGKGEKVRLMYPLMVNKTVYEGLRKVNPDKRAMILTRSSFLGQQRYGSAVWSGDIGWNWEAFKRQIPAGLNYSITGQPYWTTDCGGFFRPGDQYTNPDFEELFIRWIQFSCFSPLMRVHGYMSDTEMWRYSDTLLENSNKYIALRYRLLPYIYSEAAKVSFNASTLMRPLVMDFPHDQQALEQSYTYMFGPAVLVAPVVKAKADKWPVYLPENINGWYDFWTNQHHKGGETVLANSPKDTIPLFIPAGTILPMSCSKMQFAMNDDTMELRVYSGKDASYTVYEDSGIDYSYEKGESTRIPLVWNDKEKVLTIEKQKGTYNGMKKGKKFKITYISQTGEEKEFAVSYDGSRQTVKCK